jgi:hypothetical protein
VSLNLRTIGCGIVVFWSLWFFIVFASNFCDAMVHLQMLPSHWRFASGNFAFLEKVTSRYSVPTTVNGVLFAGVILWEALATVLFTRAAIRTCLGSSQFRETSRAAFAVGLALWAAFALVDEFFIVYDLEASHLRLFIAQLLSLAFLELVADRP